MSSSIVSNPASGLGRSRSSRCVAAAALAVALLSSSGLAATGQPPHARTEGPPASAVPRAAEVELVRNEIRTLQANLDQLKARMTQLQSERPVNPGKSATPEQAADYKKRMAEWQRKVDDLNKEIHGTQNKLNKAKARLKALEAPAGAPGGRSG